MPRFIYLACLVFAIPGICSNVIPTATGQSPPRTITVSGNGSASIPPDFLLLHFKMMANNEKLVDARNAFAKLRATVEKKIGEMNEVSLTAEFHGEVQSDGQGGNAVIMAIMGEDNNDGTFSVVEDVTLRVEFDGEMERLDLVRAVPGIIDSLVETGISFGVAGSARQMNGNENLVEFGIDDPLILEKMVTEAAMKDAIRQAAHLAELAGGRLGRVVSIETLDPVPEPGQEAGIMAIYGITTPKTVDNATTTQAFNRDIRQTGRLRVVFEILE